MANAVKTIPVLLPTRITSLATDTTLGASAEYETTDVTVNMPETTRTIQHVEIRVSARDGFTAAADFDAVRIGVQINAVAFSDTDTTVTFANSGDHTTMVMRIFPTSYFTTNDPGTATFTMAARVRFATSAIAQVNNVTIEAWITYEYLDTAATHVEHVEIPLQGTRTTTNISTTYAEIGTEGTGGCPANQIPQLTGAGGLLTENGVSVKQSWIEVIGEEGVSGTTDRTFTYRVDGATDNARHLCEQALSSATSYRDNFDLGALSTTAAHAFEIKTDVASTMARVSAILHVVYTYTVSGTTTKFNSVRVPLSNVTTDNRYPTDVTADPVRFQAVVEVQEPGPIVMQQSGFVLQTSMNNVTYNIGTAGQLARAYVAGSTAVRDFQPPVTHRGDHSLSTWDLMRGRNTLTVDVTVSVDADSFFAGGYAIVNYHSGVSASGVSAHARTTVWPILAYTERTYADSASFTPAQPYFSDATAHYTLFGSMLDMSSWATTGALFQLQARRLAGEGPGAGWSGTGRSTWIDAQELGSKHYYFDATSWWNHHGFDGNSDNQRALPERDRSDITAANRKWVVDSAVSGSTAGFAVSHWLTLHSHKYTLESTYSINGTGTNDVVVEVIGIDEGTRELRFLAKTTTYTKGAEPGVPGTFTFTVYDDTLKYDVIARHATSPGCSSGYIQRNGGNTEAPKVVARGPNGNSTTTLALADIFPTEQVRNGDIAVVYTQTETSEDVTTPTGYTAPADSPQNEGSVRLEVFYKVYNNGWEADVHPIIDNNLPTISDPGDHIAVPGVLLVRGANTSSPIDVTEGGTAASSTSVSITGDTTTVARTLVLAAVANSTDSATLQGSAWANANLTDLRARASHNTTDGAGGGVDVAAGVMASAAAVGATTATLATASGQAKHMMAIKPKTYSAASFGINVSTGSATYPVVGSPFITSGRNM